MDKNHLPIADQLSLSFDQGSLPEYEKSSQQSDQSWVEVLVDVPHLQGLYTYCVPENLQVRPGDIVSVPFGHQTTSGLVIRFKNTSSEGIENQKIENQEIRNIEEVISSQLLPDRYWLLLQQVSAYYLTDLMSTLKVALPPGFLGRSQRRIRLCSTPLPPKAETNCSPPAQEILRLLQSQKTGDYSVRYLRQKVRKATQGIKELTKHKWIESYLEEPQRVKAKLKTVVTLVKQVWLDDLTTRQAEILQILRGQGGAMDKTELIQKARTTANTLKKLAELGYLVLSEQEVLRQEQGNYQDQDLPKKLSPDQAEALKQIKAQDGYNKILLHGVTGSGKTEVYLQAIAPILDQGKSALVLVPEIGLTPQLTDRFRARFGKQVCVYHSKLSAGEKYDTWRQTLLGEPQIVIGTRSAVFAPLPHLGLIILDEEHDSSFKQNRPTPTYHARTVANWRSQLNNCPLILGSATPSLETFWETFANKHQASTKTADNAPIENVRNQHNHYLSLPQRISSRSLPLVQIVDMRVELSRGNKSIFSLALQKAIIEMQEQQQQAILFIPRRGHSTFVSCRSCGFVMECPHCDVSLSFHHAHENAAKLLRCHYCNFCSTQPKVCPECSSPYLKFFGSGTQKVTQEIQRLFPDLKAIRFDSDTTSRKNAHRDLIARFTAKEADVLIGTQMLTKGLDIEGITLVGVVSADGLLHRSDYRAAERAFQTLTQVAGRAGRGAEAGQVIIQTYSPEHQVIQAVQNHDYFSFSNNELEQREDLNYPPYGSLVLIRLSSTKEADVQKSAEAIATTCINLLDDSWSILGPAPASIFRVALRYRWQILLKNTSESNNNSQNLDLSKLKTLNDYCLSSVSMTIDVDPINID